MFPWGPTEVFVLLKQNLWRPPGQLCLLSASVANRSHNVQYMIVSTRVSGPAALQTGRFAVWRSKRSRAAEGESKNLSIEYEGFALGLSTAELVESESQVEKTTGYKYEKIRKRYGTRKALKESRPTWK